MPREQLLELREKKINKTASKEELLSYYTQLNFIADSIEILIADLITKKQ